MSRIRIQVAGLGDTTDDTSRSDGISGAVVTLTSIDAASTHLIRLITTTDPSPPVLSQTGPTTWTFTPNNGPNTYRIECITDLGLASESRTRRVYRIRSANAGLSFPAPNERADSNATIQNSGSAVIAASEDNEDGNPYGWQPSLHSWLALVDELVVGRTDLPGNQGKAWSLETGAQSFLEIDTTTASPRVRVDVPLQLSERGGDPTAVADSGFVYTKDVSSVTELFFRDSAGNVVQITSGGAVASSFDPENILIDPSSATALRVHDGTDNWLLFDTTSGNITIGNASDNPDVTVAGSGNFVVDSRFAIESTYGVLALPLILGRGDAVFGVKQDGVLRAENGGGVDETGANLYYIAGRSTGTALGASHIFQSSAAGGASNDTLNAARTLWTMDANGVLIPNLASGTTVAIGEFGAPPTQTGSVLIGQFPNFDGSSNNDAIYIGRHTSTSLAGARSVSISSAGKSATSAADSITIQSAGGAGATTGARGISIGGAGSVTGGDSGGIGYGHSIRHLYSWGIGRGATSSAQGQFIVGGDGYPTTDYYFGEGVTESGGFVATAIIFQPTEATGTDRAGLPFYIRGGRGSGDGVGGSIILQTYPLAGAGAAPHSATTRLEIDNAGAWLVGGSAGTAGYVLTSNGAGAAPTWQAASGGAFDPEDIVLADNTSGALRAHEDANDYIRVNTTDAAESIILGNATTNPSFSLLGTGALLWNAARQITLPDNTADVFRLMEGANEYFGVATTNGTEAIRFGNTTTNPSVTFAGSGALTLPTGGVSIPDNSATAFRLLEGANSYLTVNTTDASERIVLGNATTNPVIELLGSGHVEKAGPIVVGSANTYPTGTGRVIAIGEFSSVTSWPTGTTETIRIGKATNAAQSARATVISAGGMTGVPGGDSITLQSVGASGATGSRAIAIGGSAAASGADSISLGYGANAAHANAIVMGRSGISNAASQFVVGGDGQPVTDYYFGEGVTESGGFVATALTFQPTEATGTNRAGLPFYLRGGRGTGTGVGGSLIFQTYPVAGAGTTPHTATTRLEISNAGVWAASIADNNATAFQLLEGANNYLTINTTNATERILLGNATTNPVFELAGSGYIAKSGNQVMGSFSALPSGSNVVAIGTFSTSTWSNNDQVIIGSSSGNNSGSRSVSICATGRTGSQGADSITIMGANGVGATGNRAIVLGGASAAAGNDSIAIGYSASAGHANAICLGRDADSTATNQFILGGTGFPIDAFYIGEGAVKSSAFTGGDKSIQPTEATGTDRDGLPLTILGGRGTGTGNAGPTNGSLTLATYPARDSGTTQHTATPRVRVRADGTTLIGSHNTMSTTAERDEVIHRQTGYSALPDTSTTYTILTVAPENTATDMVYRMHGSVVGWHYDDGGAPVIVERFFSVVFRSISGSLSFVSYYAHGGGTPQTEVGSTSIPSWLQIAGATIQIKHTTAGSWPGGRMVASVEWHGVVYDPAA